MPYCIKQNQLLYRNMQESYKKAIYPENISVYGKLILPKSWPQEISKATSYIVYLLSDLNFSFLNYC